MNEKSMTLGRDFQVGIDRLERWHLSLKIFDVRAYWTGAECFTRSGKTIRLPERIRAELPQGVALDGGIYAGLGGFTEASEAVRLNHWTPSCQFWCYDLPDAVGAWHQRISEAARIYRRTVTFWEFEGYRETNKLLAQLQSEGHEGFVCRHPTATGYPIGRTDTMIKLKTEIL